MDPGCAFGVTELSHILDGLWPELPWVATAHSLSSLSFQIGTWIAPGCLGNSGSLRSGPENAPVEGHLAQLKVRDVSAGQAAFKGRALHPVASPAAKITIQSTWVSGRPHL